MSDAVVAAHLAALHGDGCEVVLCTCSTLGGIAEELSGDGLKVIRIGRPMLRGAVTLGPRIGLLVVLTSVVERPGPIVQVPAGRFTPARRPRSRQAGCHLRCSATACALALASRIWSVMSV